jgi:hypothetical protein
VSWDFLFIVMEKMGIINEFLNMVKVMFLNVEVATYITQSLNILK